ncbi:MAG: YjbQ family protein [Acidobacteria bacterium]|nr:YjbQ family protein [Acidobacteriota bacterium]
MIEIALQSHRRREMIDVTPEINAALAAAEAESAACHIFVPHTTAAAVINENADPDVVRDLLTAWEKLIPPVHFAHTEGNSDAHFLSTLLGPSLLVPVEAGRLRLGTWQGIFFVELDGPRSRRLWITPLPAQRES